MAAEYTLSAEIIPSLSNSFSRDVQRMIKESLAKVDASVKITPTVDAAKLQKEVNRAAREAKASVDVKVNTVVSSSQLQRELSRAAREVKASVSVKAQIDSSTLQRELTKAAGGAKSNITISPDLDDKILRAKLDNLSQRTQSSKIKAELDDANAKLKLAKLTGIERKANIKAELDKPSADKFENEASALAKRANLQFNALLFTGLFAGLPALAAAAGAGVVVGLAGVPLAFGAIGAAALKNNATVSKSFKQTSANITMEMQGIVAPIAGSLAQATALVDASFHRLAPALRAAFAGSGPEVVTFVQGFTGFAERTMPGFIAAIQNSSAPMRGLRDLLRQTGDGVSILFTNLTTGAAGAETIVGTLGGVIQDLLGFTGSLFANLANNGNPVLQQFRTTMGQVETVLLNVTSAGSPLYAFFGGFINAVSGGFSVLNAFASILRALPDAVSGFGGSLFAVTRIASAFGINVGQAFDGLGTKINEAKGWKSKVTTGLGGLAAGIFNPLTLAVGAASLGLELWGQRNQDVQADVQAHAQRVQDLKAALIQSRGAIDDNVRSLVANQLTSLKVSDGVRNVISDVQNLAGPAGVQQLTAGYMGNVTAMGTLQASLQRTADSHSREADALGLLRAPFDDHIRVVNGVAVQYDATGFAAKQLLDIIERESPGWRAAQEAQAAYTRETEHNATVTAQQMTPAMYAAKTATADLDTAFKKLNETGGDTVAKGKAIIDLLDQLSGRKKSTEEAIQSFNTVIRDLGDNFKDVHGHLIQFPKDITDASGAISTVTKSGSDLQDTVEKGATDMATYAQSLKDAGVPADQIQTKLGGMREQLAEQLRLHGLLPDAIQRVLDHYDAIPSHITTALGLQGDIETQKKLTDIASQLAGLDGKKVGVHVNALTEQAQSSLLTLGDTIVRLPDGTFQVFANTEEGRAAAKALTDQVGNTRVSMAIDGNIDPVTGKVRLAVQNADGSVGFMNVDAHIDKATGATLIAVQKANGSTGFMTVDAFNDAAKTKVGDAVRVANNARGFIQLDFSFSRTASEAVRAEWDRIFNEGAARATAAPRLNLHGIAATKATGGLITGPGTGTSDSIPVRLSNGEFVVTAAATARHRGLLEALNAQGFAAGGLVGFAAGGSVTTPAAAPSVGPVGAAPVLLDPALLRAITEALLALNAATVTLSASDAGLTASTGTLAATILTQLVPALSGAALTANVTLVPALLGLQATNANTGASMTNLAVTTGLQWTIIANAVWSSVQTQQGAHEALKNSLAVVRTSFTDTANWANAEFQRAYWSAANPIRDVINLPIHGLVDAWNSLDAQFSLGKHIQAPVAAFATGGFVSGPGNGTSDSIPARLSDGEFVIREKVTKKVTPFLNALNDGQPEALKAAGFAAGGIVANTGSALNEATSRGLAFARAQAGKPYVWGGVGPDGYDCSGFMSAITNVLRGESNPHRRLGVAESQPWPGFLPGLGSAFATGFSATHTAGTLAGVNVEAAGPPVAVGGGAHGADDAQFGGHAFLPVVGGNFVSGGSGGIDMKAIISQAFSGVQGQIDGVTGAYPGNIAAAIGGGVAQKASEGAQSRLGELTAAIGARQGGVGGGVEQWRGVVLQALAMLGLPGSLADTTLRRMNQESGGNAMSVNNWDSNAARGTPSRGLMQVIDPTFRANMMPGFGNIMAPLDNILASMRYTLGRYGSLPAGYDRPGGYDTGGMLDPGQVGINNLRKPEAVLTPKETAAYQAQARAATENRETRLDQYSIDRLAASIMAAAERRPIEVRSSGIGLTGGGI